MAKEKTVNYEEVFKDLIFMLEQSFIIEHKQDYEGICKLRKKYKVSL